MEPLEIDLNVEAHASAPDDHSMHEDLDTYNFHEEVDEALDGAVDIDYNGDDVEDSPDTVMNPLMDLLQTLGVDVLDAVDYCKRVVRPMSICATTFGESYRPTLFEFYGQGNLVKASHGPRRNLNLDGLRAFDLRTSKPNGEPWDFSRSSDRREARRHVEEEKPTWVIGSPPCTFFSRWNQAMKHKKHGSTSGRRAPAGSGATFALRDWDLQDPT